MQLSSEDSLKLNVILANKPLAIRINESRMTLSALFTKNETEIQLNPTIREDHYLKLVREMISGQVLGSPGGYPVFLQRWTRMGQMRKESVEQLLMLGEQEAVVAAAFSTGLSDEMAKRIWWAMEDPENARQMLQNKAVVEGEMGAVLAAFLIEFLPFETEAEIIIESIRLILQPNLISPEEQQKLWDKGQRKTVFLIGFLIAMPNQLPITTEAHPNIDQLNNASAHQQLELLKTIHSEQGQAFLFTVLKVSKKPSNQEVLMEILKAIASYFSAMRTLDPEDKTLDEIEADYIEYQAHLPPEVSELIQQYPAQEKNIHAMYVLARLNYGVIRPVLLTSTAMGSLMRKKIKPVMDPITQYLNQLKA